VAARAFALLLLAPAVSAAPAPAGGPITSDAPAGRPEAIVDLDTAAGLALVRGEWRYADARLVEVAHREPGPDLKASGAANRTWDLVPRAGAADYDDSAWPVLGPGTLKDRRGHGRLSFNWYRLRFTVPEKIGALETAGGTAIFEVVVDDYAEVWVDGRLPLVLGQSGGPLVRGWNAPNRIVISDRLVPGSSHTIAVFGANGPLSDPPANFIWVRSATLEFHAPDRAGDRRVPVEVTRIDPGLDAVLAGDPVVERIAGGFQFTEGPVWHPDGYLLFSDPNANTIYRWSPDLQVSVFRARSGYAGVDAGLYKQPGSNGLTLDPEGRLTIDQHGERRVVRLERNGVLTTLADRYEGRRLNSPNDLVYRSDGALYFTDPPFGLPAAHEDPRRELPYAGVFLLRDGRLTLVSRELAGPNGLALSPDETALYVGDWDPKRKVVMRYDVSADGTLSSGRPLVDLTSEPGEDAIDGIKVDVRGNVYVCGPGGLWIVAPTGRRLGLLRLPENPHNIAFGGEDGRTLFIAAETSLYRVRLAVEGIRPRLTAAASGSSSGTRAATGGTPRARRGPRASGRRCASS
jgi:gluconolactonase